MTDDVVRKAARMERALRSIVRVLGPEVCDCEDCCKAGLQEEAGEALRIAKGALGES